MEKRENTPIMFLSKTNNVAVGGFGAIVGANGFRIVLHSGTQAHAIIGLAECSFEFLDAEQVNKMFANASNDTEFEEVSVLATDISGTTAVFAGMKLRRA